MGGWQGSGPAGCSCGRKSRMNFKTCLCFGCDQQSQRGLCVLLCEQAQKEGANAAPHSPLPCCSEAEGGGHWKLLYLPAVSLGLPRAEQSWKRRKPGMCTQQAARLLLSPDVQQMQRGLALRCARMSWAESLGAPACVGSWSSFRYESTDGDGSQAPCLRALPPQPLLGSPGELACG